MKRLLSLLLCLSFVSCATTEITASPPAGNTKTVRPDIPLALTPTLVHAKIIPTKISPAPTAAPTVTLTPTLTLEVPCDPFRSDYCITDGHFLLQRPIQPPENDRIDSSYGYGSTANGTREPHHGVEFPNPSGTPVHAAADGIVIFAGPDQAAMFCPWGNFYGNLVVIQHGEALFTLYAHLSKIDVRLNQQVFSGEKIGEVGRTGGAIGSHLHFEVRRGDGKDYFSTQNPALWLVPAKDANGSLLGTLMISVVDADGKLVENANFTIAYYSDPSQSPVKVFYVSPYSSDLLLGEENAALGELESGRYRIAVELHGQILERWVEVQSGRLTRVSFVVK